MKALMKRLERLEQAGPTGALDLYFGSDGNGAPTRRRKGIGAIDLIELEKLCTLQCSDREIAAWFGVTETVIQRWRKRRSFRQATERGRAKGKVFVRRAQMQMLEKGNPTMAIWLGKQILGQGERVETTDQPIPVIIMPRAE